MNTIKGIAHEIIMENDGKPRGNTLEAISLRDCAKGIINHFENKINACFNALVILRDLDRGVHTPWNMKVYRQITRGLVSVVASDLLREAEKHEKIWMTKKNEKCGEVGRGDRTLVGCRGL